MWIATKVGSRRRHNQSRHHHRRTDRFPYSDPWINPERNRARSDGNIWFGEEHGHKVGRITPSGQITEFPVPESAASLAVGPEGDIWFSQGQQGLARITPTGEVSTFPVEHGRYPSASPLTAGPDGRLWFHSETNVLGRISPAGRVSNVRLPYREGTLIDAAAGPDGSIWYTAAGQSPNEGGGGTGQATIYSQPGMVGRIIPGALAVRLGGSTPSAHARWARVSVSCEGGTAESTCQGGLRLSQGRMALGHRRYHLNADETSVIRVRLSRRGAARLHQKGRLSVKATATLVEGRTSTRGLVLRLGSRVR